jgi:hypothetical protein
MVDSMPPFPFTDHFPQEPPWRLRGISRVLGIAAHEPLGPRMRAPCIDLLSRVIEQYLISGFHLLLRTLMLLSSEHIKYKLDGALVFRKRTIYDGKLEVRMRYVHPEWYISAAGRA